MQDDPESAHYLHRRRGLAPVLHLPFEGARALGSVVGRDVILVGDDSGGVYAVDPAMGSSVWVRLESPVLALGGSTRGKRLVVLTEDGQWHLFDREGESLASGTHRFTHGVYVWGEGSDLYAGGQTEDGAAVWAFEEEAVEHVLPVGCVWLASQGGPRVAWAGESGLRSCAIEDLEGAGPQGSSWAEVFVSKTHVLWQVDGGVLVQGCEAGPSVTIDWTDFVAGAVDPTGERALLTSEAGEVGLVELQSGDRTPHVVEIEDQVVGAVQFSARGPWVGTLGDEFRLWTWHES
jgi:hypothetical protein